MATILFDFDGVLADTLEDMLNFAQKACARLGIRRIPIPADLDALGSMSFVDYGHQLGVPEPQIDEFVRSCLEMFNQREQPPEIFEGMEKVLVQSATWHAVGIVTGNTTATVEAFLKHHAPQVQISIIVGVEQEIPRPEKIRLALKYLPQNTEPAFMVGDALSDIRAARQTGLKSIAVGWGHQSVSRLETENPDYLVRSPQELLDLLKMIRTDGYLKR